MSSRWRRRRRHGGVQLASSADVGAAAPVLPGGRRRHEQVPAGASVVRLLAVMVAEHGRRRRSHVRVARVGARAPHVRRVARPGDVAGDVSRRRVTLPQLEMAQIHRARGAVARAGAWPRGGHVIGQVRAGRPADDRPRVINEDLVGDWRRRSERRRARQATS